VPAAGARLRTSGLRGVEVSCDRGGRDGCTERGWRVLRLHEECMGVAQAGGHTHTGEFGMFAVRTRLGEEASRASAGVGSGASR